MDSISFFGPQAQGLYQLGTLCYLQATTGLIGRCSPTVGLFLLDCSNGHLIDAADMVVKVQPGFLKQGKKDKFGDSECFHVKVEGNIVPDSLLASLGSSLPTLSGSKNTCFRVINDADTSKERIFVPYGTGSFLQAYSRYHYPFKTLSFGDGSEVTGTYNCPDLRKSRTFVWDSFGKLYRQYVEITVTGEMFQYPKVTGDSNCRQGTRKQGIQTLSNGSWSWSTNLVNNGLYFRAFCRPTTLDSISSEVLLTGDDGSPLSLMIKDALAISEVDLGNSPWLACSNAVQSVKETQVMMLAFLRDAYHWNQLIPPLRSFAGLATPAMWASLFLWFSYGVRPTIGDVSHLVKDFEDLGNRPIPELAKKFAQAQVKYGTSYARDLTFKGAELTGKCNARVMLRPKIQIETILGQLLLILESLGIGVDARNVWELIPYSFIVDWFVNANEFMSYIDLLSMPSRYDILQVVTSQKYEVTLPANLYLSSAAGFIRLTVYRRGVSSTIPKQPFELRFTPPNSHWLEATSLLVSRH